MATVLIRTAIIYILITIAIRLMGKRQVGELQLFELITTFMISELAINPIQDISIPISYSIIPLIFIFSMEVISSFLVTKSSSIKKLLMGSPSIIIKNGIINQKELARLRIGINELISELRLKDVSDISDVDYAILEQNGKLSVFLKSEKQTISIEDLNLKKKSSGIAHVIINNGEVNIMNLNNLNKTQKWLQNNLKNKNLNPEDIFLMTIDDNNKMNIILKEEK